MSSCFPRIKFPGAHRSKLQTNKWWCKLLLDNGGKEKGERPLSSLIPTLIVGGNWQIYSELEKRVDSKERFIGEHAWRLRVTCFKRHYS